MRKLKDLLENVCEWPSKRENHERFFAQISHYTVLTQFSDFGDIRENIIAIFPQLQCLVGTFRSNLVNFVKI